MIANECQVAMQCCCPKRSSQVIQWCIETRDHFTVAPILLAAVQQLKQLRVCLRAEALPPAANAVCVDD